MIRPYAVLGFLAAVLPLVATPGASLTLLVDRVVRRGRRQALWVVLGTVTGLYVHAALAAAGLSALVLRSSEAFTVVRLAGAVYLVGLGVSTWRPAAGGRAEPARRRPPWRTGSTYLQALVGNVLNPKAASIFLTLVPQFVVADRPLTGQILVLATAQALLVSLWLCLWACFFGQARRGVLTPRVRTIAARVTGGTLVVLGVRSATA